ncbi:peptidoglycan DD-metalloendopeptidase family protein [Candidatus Poseidoniaceae archaeon]|nr:peptidoglycan DD-metalloendopeptidase family protein [Candidatus Poseidoniaceae archaeon]
MVQPPNGFHTVVNLPEHYWVFDFTKGVDASWECPFDYQIGRYDEIRPGMYEQELFSGNRDLHVGIDIGAPQQTEVFAFTDGIIHSFGINSEDGSYGPTIITQHQVSLASHVGSQKMNPITTIWVLHGHLATESLEGLEIGQEVRGGQLLARIGNKSENGGWEPHLHIQLSLIEPITFDLEGVVARENRQQALQQFPDPRLILGEIY